MNSAYYIHIHININDLLSTIPIFHFILKSFTQGTIQSKYCFTIGPAKATYKIKKFYTTKIYNKNKRCRRLFFLEFGPEGID